MAVGGSENTFVWESIAPITREILTATASYSAKFLKPCFLVTAVLTFLSDARHRLLTPYNLVVSPDGKTALTADNGGSGSSDGNVDTVSIIDLELKPPRVIDKLVVGDGPEGIAISPKGDVAVAVILAGSNNKAAFFHRPKGYVSVLRVDGKKVTKVKEIDVGGLPEAAVFTPDGKYLLVGNYLDQDFSIPKVDGTDVTDTGHRFKVPGHPASARGSAR
jgi:DNA-binding beta-propeller fold protein YncE